MLYLSGLGLVNPSMLNDVRNKDEMLEEIFKEAKVCLNLRKEMSKSEFRMTINKTNIDEKFRQDMTEVNNMLSRNNISSVSIGLNGNLSEYCRIKRQLFESILQEIKECLNITKEMDNSEFPIKLNNTNIEEVLQRATKQITNMVSRNNRSNISISFNGNLLEYCKIKREKNREMESTTGKTTLSSTPSTASSSTTSATAPTTTDSTSTAENSDAATGTTEQQNSTSEASTSYTVFLYNACYLLLL